ncbi:hypothetical protein QIS99_24075 [Streptomyces sp. B-S-A8]|uniref:Uncharacterized protein n=1 Tax=Streptomyces solicavernae TaxID=3043614 RepID=A0ABT6RXS6_9ACTN|nr:hypothetical protein [Streptomyces sp. B-S-A8]MDI3389251.1 hypothetical protein [Streptomyces sp. B-S-A8]
MDRRSWWVCWVEKGPWAPVVVVRPPRAARAGRAAAAGAAVAVAAP